MLSNLDLSKAPNGRPRRLWPMGLSGIGSAGKSGKGLCVFCCYISCTCVSDGGSEYFRPLHVAALPAEPGRVDTESGTAGVLHRGLRADRGFGGDDAGLVRWMPERFAGEHFRDFSGEYIDLCVF